MPSARISLDNPAFAGRLRSHSWRSDYERRAVLSYGRAMSDVRPAPKATLRPAAHPTVRRASPNSAPVRQTRSTVLMRQMVAGKRQAKRRKIHFNARGIVLSSLAGVLFLFGIGVGFTQLHTNKEVEAQVKTLAAQTQVVEESGDAPTETGLPSEEKPTGSVGSYKAAPESPKIISIPDLGVKARVLRMGVKPNNEIKTPNNIYDTGWFENSARPGELGAVFVNAHVHGPSKPGVFAGLKKLKSGQKITIERGDGQVFTYSVVKTEVYDKNNVDMGAALNSAVPGRPGLTLMTCEGRYTTEGGYDKRRVVFAVQD